MGQAELGVFVNDLYKAEKVFKDASAEYQRHMPQGGFSSPDAGGGEINRMVDVTVRTIGELHMILAQAMDQHGRKLGIAADRLKFVEQNATADVINLISVNGVLQDLTTSKYLPPKDYKSPIPD
jgi:hypothetical protein